MSGSVRLLLISFVAIAAGSSIYAWIMNKHLETVTKYENSANDASFEQDRRKTCQQLISAQVCTSPVDAYDRWSCSDRLASIHCDKYIDTGYLIREKERQKYAHPRKDWRVDMLRGHLGK